MVSPGQQFPNIFFVHSDGSSSELYALRKKEHALLLLVGVQDHQGMALMQGFQEQTKTFEWLKTRLFAVFEDEDKIPQPWSLPGLVPVTCMQQLPEGVAWGQGYLVSLNRTLYSLYPDLLSLDAKRVEDDILHWEATHCMA